MVAPRFTALGVPTGVSKFSSSLLLREDAPFFVLLLVFANRGVVAANRFGAFVSPPPRASSLANAKDVSSSSAEEYSEEEDEPSSEENEENEEFSDDDWLLSSSSVSSSSSTFVFLFPRRLLRLLL